MRKKKMMRKLILICVVVGLLFVVGTAQAATVITDAAGLQAMANNLAGDYVLGADIDLTGFPWVAIGHTEQDRFTGTFDGNYHIINGLTAADTDTEDGLYKNCSLFGVLGEGGVVKNVGLTNVNVSAGWYCAALVGDVYGEVTNCFAINGTVSVAGDCGNTGTLIGMTRDEGSISNCYSTLEFILPASSGWPNIHGGFIGHVAGPVTNCYYAGVITPTGDVSGGGFFGNGNAESIESLASSCYLDVEVCGVATLDSAGNITEGGLTTAEMMQQSTYVDWDFVNIWTMIEGETYPTFVWLRDPRIAGRPNPADEATDVPRDVVLSWEPGESANTHDVYLGTVFDDVNDADRSDPRGMLANQGQIDTTYDPGHLDFGQTYYWRIDEVNAPPDSTIFKGDAWSFTTEPIGYPIAGVNITTTASSSGLAQGPENTVNGSGLDVNYPDLHSNDITEMWLSDSAGPQPTWIQYEFDKVYKLHEMLVWNHNGIMEPMIGVGFKDVSIEYSVNGTDYTTLGTTHEFAQASGAADYEHNTTVDFGGTPAKFVRLTANSNWVGFLPQYGLSEVRFLYIPVFAREPSPDSGATDVAIDVTLGFRAGREAAKHDVYLSTDEQAVIDGTAPVSTVTEASYSTPLDLGSTYYWRVDEVNDAETPSTWQGDIWNLSTQEFLVVDDFELYNDLDPGDPESNRIFNTWIDGYGITTNGSIVGYDVAPFAEQSIVHGGRQSMPFSYDNSTAGYSEATANVADLQVGQDWTKGAAETLVLWIYGDLSNAVAGQLYVKINDTKVMYDGDITEPIWKQWNIELASLGINLSNITTVSIGVDGGGSGMLYVDDIALYK